MQKRLWSRYLRGGTDWRVWLVGPRTKFRLYRHKQMSIRTLARVIISLATIPCTRYVGTTYGWDCLPT